MYSIADDADFHRLLFETAGNKVLLRFASLAGELLRSRRVRESPLREHYARDLAEHRAIFEAVRSGKPRQAAQAMEAHLRTTPSAIIAEAQECG